MTRFIVASADDCIGCRTCELACALEHEPGVTQLLPRLTVMRLSQLSVPVMCHQCENAPCVAACPVAALTMGAASVEADDSRCIGCQSCAVACPFGAITIVTSENRHPRIVKCDMCGQRDAGPACVEVCPTTALRIMTDDALAALQKQQLVKHASLLNRL
ncbi:4Fe-4S dicluster domain-containing protein [Trabulsiella odontotermitis]|uniref:4Fe-4S dicluster domain-containing protein n=1 Tax=Trabulsiella odontotermitis TaxID=379893 RepID=UPI0024B7DF74|nr:4Fe-4S dicluster domain-containing protein [Trabulsiella odontotermitis]WHP31898.1 4Fe-4S dicluster domain-containing protein [Trabulsiella odontotermitis]